MRQEKAKEPVVMTTEEMMKKEIAEMTEQHDVIWNNELAYYFKKGLIPAKSELYIA